MNRQNKASNCCVHLYVEVSLNSGRSVCCRVGNMLFSVETQTTEERTQQYQSEIESIYKDLTTKGKALMLSTELGVSVTVRRFKMSAETPLSACTLTLR